MCLKFWEINFKSISPLEKSLPECWIFVLSKICPFQDLFVIGCWCWTSRVLVDSPLPISDLLQTLQGLKSKWIYESRHNRSYFRYFHKLGFQHVPTCCDLANSIGAPFGRLAPSAGGRSPSTLPTLPTLPAPVATAAETSPRSPSVCSWEMLDFDEAPGSWVPLQLVLP